MSGENSKDNLRIKGIYNLGFALCLSFLITAAAFGQTTENTQTASVPNTDGKIAAKAALPVLTNYKEIKIGTTADEVRDKLGKAEIDDKDGFYYEISDNEFAQIRIDEDKKVRFVATTYSGESDNTPKFEDVFGKEIAVETKPDGSIYKLVRYPEAGYWVAYSRTAGDKPTVTVTMQKMQIVK